MNILLWVQMLPQSVAICGTYIGGVSSEYFNKYAQVAFVRHENQSTLNIVNDIQGDSLEIDSFPLVVPVPEVTTTDAANVLEPEFFDRLNTYSQPRLVQYECFDFIRVPEEMTDGGSGTSCGGEPNV